MFGTASAVIFGILSLVGLATASASLSSVGIMGFFVSLGTWLWSRFAPQNLTYERKLSQDHAFFDEELSLTITLTNNKPIPVTWIEIEDEFPEDLAILGKDLKDSPKRGVRNLSHKVSLGPFEKISWNYRLHCYQRGAYQIGPAILRTGDPFGFFEKWVSFSKKDSLLVYPKVVPVRLLDLDARSETGDTRGKMRLNQDTGTMKGFKEYEAGDPLKLIDWKATARHNRLLTRVLEPDNALVAIPLLNIDTTGVPYGGFVPKNLERVITVAASITWESLIAGRSVGIVTNGKSVLYERPMSVRPGRNPKQLSLIFEALAMASPFVGSQIDHDLLITSRKLPPGATFLFITGIMNEAIQNALEILASQNRAPLVLWVSDWEPEGIPDNISWKDLSRQLSSLEEHHDIPV